MSRKNARQEESEEEDEFADTDPDKRYCYCQLKWDGATPMVACDSCNNWFHFVCAFLDPEHPPDVWYCDPCEEKQGVSKKRSKTESRAAKTGGSVTSNTSYMAAVDEQLQTNTEARRSRLASTSAANDSKLDSDTTPNDYTGPPMTFEEKKAVSNAVYALEPDALVDAVKLIQREAPEGIKIGGEDEMTLDFDAINDATLRRLARDYVKTATKI